MKVVYLGTPDFAIPSLESLLNTTWVKILAVCTQTDKQAGRGNKIKEPPVKKLALEKSLLLFQAEKISQDKELIKRLKDLNPDILITCAFGQILNQEVLDIAPLGVINVHASLLPKYRGAAPINWAIIKGETETGVSIMKTELGLDTGPVLLQEKCTIDENETAVELTNKLSLLGASALVNALNLINKNEAKFIPQDNSQVSKAPSLKKELGLIKWDDTTKNIHNKIRAIQPWPSAYTHFNNTTVKLWESRIPPLASCLLPLASESGTIIEIKDYIRVKTQDSFIDIYKVQPENKKIINSKDWVNGARIKIGDKFANR